MPVHPARPGKRFLLVYCLMAVIVVPGAACGSSSGSSPSGSGTLKIITWVNPPALAALKTIDAEFHKKYPAINVQLQTAANVNGPYETLLQQTVDTGSADIVTTADPFQPLPRHQTRSSMTPLQYWSTSGVFAPLNGQNFLSAYTPAAIAAETYKGRVYGVVSGSYQEGVFYNKAIFARYHLGVPATYTQFLGVLRTLKSHSVTPMFLGLGNVGPVYLQFLYYETMIDLWYPHAPGGNLAQDLESGVVKWTSPYFTQAMNEERTLAQYLEPDYTGVPWEAMPGDFAKGSAAMLLDGSWDLATIQQANPSLQAGFFPLPASNVVQDNQPCVGDNLTFEVLRGAANKAAALKWLQFFSTASVYAQYVNITGISPSQSRGSFSSYSARVLGSWFGKGVNLDVFYPLLAGSNGYYDQSAHWPDLQLDVIQGARTPAQAQALYQSAWTAP